MTNIYRKDFPILETTIKNKPLVYLDNAATMQMAKPVMDAMLRHQMNDYANIHRGIHTLSERSTAMVEEARSHIARFIGAQSPKEIIFTSGTTAGINLVARSFVDTFAQTGEEFLVTQMEHHSNYVPWREFCQDKATFVVCPVTKTGDLDMEKFGKLLSGRTLLVAITYVSNVTGAVNDIKTVIDMAHNAGAAVLVDCAQAMRHTKINVQELDCDFCVFSGHKIGGPTGTGILYGKYELLDLLRPQSFGGGMIKEVTDRMTVVEDIPLRLEAGTPNITGIAGLDAAIRYLEGIGIDTISQIEDSLLEQAEDVLKEYDRVQILGAPKKRASAISFNIDGLSSFDVAKLLDAQGIAVRSGHHCAMPLLQAFGLDGAVRISPAFYNTEEEIVSLHEAMDRIMAIRI